MSQNNTRNFNIKRITFNEYYSFRWVKRYLEVYEEQKSLQDENNLHHKRNQVRTKGNVGKEKVILVLDVEVVGCLSMHVLEFLKNKLAKLYIYFFYFSNTILFDCCNSTTPADVMLHVTHALVVGEVMNSIIEQNKA